MCVQEAGRWFHFSGTPGWAQAGKQSMSCPRACNSGTHCHYLRLTECMLIFHTRQAARQPHCLSPAIYACFTCMFDDINGMFTHCFLHYHLQISLCFIRHKLHTEPCPSFPHTCLRHLRFISPASHCHAMQMLQPLSVPATFTAAHAPPACFSLFVGLIDHCYGH